MICLVIVAITVWRGKFFITLFKISSMGKLPYWREIDWNIWKNKIHITAHHGYRNHPDSVENWNFDIKNDKASYYKNTDFGKINNFEGSVSEVLDRHTDQSLLKDYIFKVLRTFTGWSIIILCIFAVFTVTLLHEVQSSKIFSNTYYYISAMSIIVILALVASFKILPQKNY